MPIHPTPKLNQQASTTSQPTVSQTTQYQNLPQAHSQPQSFIDPGRTVVTAQKPLEPAFVAQSKSINIKRVMHSETYVKFVFLRNPSILIEYFQDISSPCTTILLKIRLSQNGTKQFKLRTKTQWFNGNCPMSGFRYVYNTHTNLYGNQHRSAPHRTYVLNFIFTKQSANGSKTKEDEIVNAFWQLRNQLIEGTTNVCMPSCSVIESAPQPPGFDEAGPSTSSGIHSNNGGNTEDRRKGS